MRYRSVILIVAFFTAILTSIGSKIARKHPRREDMHHPVRLLTTGIAAMGGGVSVAVYGILQQDYRMPLAFGALLMLFGLAALLCWKNQTIVMPDEEHFVYTTMFASKHEYRFADIAGITGDRDRTLLMKDGGKVFMEGSAEITSRLANAINAALQSTQAASL